jgi:HK97 family phage portal protein
VTATAWWDWFITDSLVLANAYIYKHRASPNQPPMALQWLAADMVRPAGSLTDSLTGYIYTADGWKREMTLEDVIHLRIGRDPSDWRFGRGPLASVLREVCTDNVASSTAYGLAKSPVPSFVVGPKDPTQAYTTTEDDAITTKQRLQENFSGDDSGGVAVMTNAFELQRVGFSPKDMALDDVRRKPEERICAALGLNPLVLHLGSGLERSTYSNLQQATRSAWTDGMVPLYRRIAEVLTQNLLPDFPETQPGDYLEFDTSDIPALATDLTAEAERAERLYKAGIIDRATAKRISNVVTVPEDDGLYFGDVPLMPQTTQPGTAPATSSTLSPTDINKLVGSATALIRAGFAPEAALLSVGLDPIQHLGLLPVTIKEAAKSVEAFAYGERQYTAEDVLRLHHQIHDDREFSDWLATKRVEILGKYVKSNTENDIHPAYGYPV